MGELSSHIAAWEAAGLIDRATADRLRAASATATEASEAGATDVVAPTAWPGPVASEAAVPAADRQGRGFAALFGPGVSIGEMFAYVGAIFLLGAWIALTRRWSATPDGSSLASALGILAAAGVLVGLAAWLRTGSERFQRAAGVALAAATGLVGFGVLSLFPPQGDTVDHLPTIAGSVAALVAAIAFRVWLPSVVTHLGTLYTATFAASTVLGWIRDTIAPVDYGSIGGATTAASAIDPLVLLVAEAALWGLLAIAFGAIGLREANDDSPAASRRAAASRAWAGLTAVIGVASAVTRSTYVARSGLEPTYQRALEPWIADLLILLVCAVLVERGFRREASAYVYPAALGVIIAATDLNATYLSDTIEIGLVIEGGILILAGILADRLRRRIGMHPTPPSLPPAPGAAPA